MEPVSITALWTAAARGRESERPDRLFDDNLSGSLAGSEGQLLLGRITDAIPEAGIELGVPIRTRFVDDVLVDATSNHAIDQVVILAAGMDTRAFRLKLGETVTIFEVDRLDLFALKEERLRKIGVVPSCHRRVIGADLARGIPAQFLEDAGFSAGKRTAWVVEGLLVYLDRKSVDRLLQQVTELSARGSVFVGDLVGEAALDSPYTRRIRRLLERAGTPMVFGCDNPAGLMDPYGWETESQTMKEFAVKVDRIIPGDSIAVVDDQPAARLFEAHYRGD